MVQSLCDFVARSSGRKIEQRHRITSSSAAYAGSDHSLKKLVAHQALDIDMLKEISAGNF